jgi:threonine dehydrogenase-like Zn-dependent dehydrogenase
MKALVLQEYRKLVYQDVSLPEMQDDEVLRLQGSCAINGEYPAILELIAAKRLNMTSISSAEAPLSEGAMWFERLYNKEKGLMKVVLLP